MSRARKTLTLSHARTMPLEVQAALKRFAVAYLRATDKHVRTLCGDGVFAIGLGTNPPELGEEYDTARKALIEFGYEWPILHEIDYAWQSEQIRKSLKDAPEDEYSEEYAATEKLIKQLEDRLAVIGLQLHKSSK